MSATQTTGDVEAAVVQNEAQEAGAAPPADATATALQVGSQPPGNRDNTGEATGEGTRTTGTVVIIIRRP